MDAYLEPQFSPHSHGFRPERGCHTALREIYHNWVGSVWFIEGDISKCFDALSHEVLLSVLRESIKDERFIHLIRGLLNAGYLEEWRWNQTYSGTPQGSIVSPILANVYLDKLDKFVEQVLIPEYTKGKRRKPNPVYEKLYIVPSIWPKRDEKRKLRHCGNKHSTFLLSTLVTLTTDGYDTAVTLMISYWDLLVQRRKQRRSSNASEPSCKRNSSSSSLRPRR